MKKIILFLSILFFIVGCDKKNQSEYILNELESKITNSTNYQITATLEIYRNEEKFYYDVISTYQTGDYFNVKLINKTNNHEQIILKDKESVYVLTPSLNKKFKFQSEWPYNSSQIYLLQPILSDIKNDKERLFEKNDTGNIITSNVNYSGEQSYKKQKVYLNKNNELEKIEVLDNNDNVKMILQIISVEYNIKLDENIFDVNKYQKDESNNNKIEPQTEKEFSATQEIVYPMYVPSDTYLTNQDIIKTEKGERVILTFGGGNQFTLVQENFNNDSSLEYVYGDPYLIMDTVGSITDYSVSWISNGIEYSVLSDNLSVDELLTVAQSISIAPVGK